MTVARNVRNVLMKLADDLRFRNAPEKRTRLTLTGRS